MAVDGVYEMVTKAPIGDQKSTMVFKTDGTTLIGTNTDAKTGDVTEFTGTVDGNSFEFPVTLKAPIGKLKCRYIGTVDGDKVSGNVKTMVGFVPFEGIRK